MRLNRKKSVVTSRLKAFLAFFDNFTNVTVGSLGKSTSNGLWGSIKGVWFSDGVSAKTLDQPATYPISAVQMSSGSTTSSVSTGSGGNVVSLSGTVGSILVGGTSSGLYTYGKPGFFEATITGMTSTVGLAVGNWIYATNGSGSLYGGSPDYVEITSIESASSVKYRVKGGTTPTAGSVTNISTRGNDGGTGLALWVTDSGNWWGVSYGRSIDTSCNCSTCNSSSCIAYTNYASQYCGGYSNYGSSYCGGYGLTTSSYCGGWTNYSGSYCGQWNNFQTNYCSAYQSQIYYSCSGYGTTTSFTCNQYRTTNRCGFYAGGQCVYWVAGTQECVNWSSSLAYQCTSGFGFNYINACSNATYGYTSVCVGGTYTAWSPSCSGGIYTAYVPFCNGGTYTAYSPSCSGGTYTTYSPACSNTTYSYSSCNCQTCYPGYIRVFQSASNAVTEMARWTLSSMAAAFKVITNKTTKTITVKPYKDKGMSSQIGTDLTYTASNATIETKFGIVLSPSDYIQGNQADDFKIASN